MANDDLLEALDADEDKTGIHSVQPIDLIPEPRARSAALICISGRSIGQMFLLAKDETTIGRAPECDVFLDDEGVSRNHAKIIRQDETLIMMDLGSTNGTYAEGERVQVLTLHDGLKIQVGTATILQFRYQDQREVQFHTLMQTFKTHDPMTEAFNKRAFLMEIEKEVGFSRRHGQPLALIMFDLDHFKKVNDTYGHAAGDLVIRAVAQRVMQGMRKEDIFARYGGEEFALLLRSTNIEGAFIVAERLRRGIEELEVTHNGRRIPCTVSVGVALLDENVTRPTELIEAADERLYQAKRKGRNRTESALFD
ncbi:MAG: diguanylate cyclase [Deltaproteobacteria bacterium]|jgi:two-component system cell cycle response regulator|nr:diguanylate cyclase [Deltaproteobacteria bacterium]